MTFIYTLMFKVYNKVHVHLKSGVLVDTHAQLLSPQPGLCIVHCRATNRNSFLSVLPCLVFGGVHVVEVKQYIPSLLCLLQYLSAGKVSRNYIVSCQRGEEIDFAQSPTPSSKGAQESKKKK